ncbi:nitroreductase family deazaflavin-dependent oxidoreductase [Frankia sp. QA3]|uniref:nitroreductase family deazaflavin-dependent oxidoreductase n=1 Tax=Frankia sp. QA3 TaxID=710111 RepID=UPI000269CAD4|nr:nitroreductase family deazaflavin-dependent oxidoreductase [Frankia sp. QA3]EIV93176.1 deazaflavin-dependent nitroreductase family protein [Frankia sp. QA3]
MSDTQDPRSPGFDIRAVNQTVIAEYRATGGALEKTLPGSRLVLLTTTGRRSGREHTTPLGYVTDDAHGGAAGDDQAGGSGQDGRHGRIIVFASNMAAPRHPDWYRNLTANPKVTVELGTDRFPAQASTATGAERERLYQALVETMPGIRGHQEQVEREIPVVVLAALG